MPVLAKVRGWKCQWPAVVWSLKLCLRKDMEQLLESHKEGAAFPIFLGSYGTGALKRKKYTSEELACDVEQALA